MNRRNAAEKLIEDNFAMSCEECPFTTAECSGRSCTQFARQWLKENPESNDWQELKADEYSIDVYRDEHDDQVIKVRYQKKQPKAPNHDDIVKGHLEKMMEQRFQYHDFPGLKPLYQAIEYLLERSITSTTEES